MKIRARAHFARPHLAQLTELRADSPARTPGTAPSRTALASAICMLAMLTAHPAFAQQKGDHVEVHPAFDLNTPTADSPENLAAANVVGNAQPASAGAAVAAIRAPNSDSDVTADDVPWALSVDQHPLPLRYAPLPPVTSLYLTIPAAADIKLMLPGAAADAAQTVHNAASEYLTSMIGQASTSRSRQMEALGAWVARTNQQAETLGSDPWERYEFSRESLRTLVAFRDKISTQSQPQTSLLVQQVRAAMGQITPLVNLLPTYELRMSWYNLLVQLKDGAGVYVNQVDSADQAMLKTIDEYLSVHAAVERPLSDPPPRPVAGRVAKPAVTASSPASVSIQDGTHAPAAPAPAAQSSTSGVLTGAILAVFALLTGVWIFLKVRGARSGGVTTKSEPKLGK